MGKKYYTDQERYEFCRRFKISGKTQREFCIENHINVDTFRDWLKAFRHLTGSFINVSNALAEDEYELTEDDVRVNMLSDQEKFKKSSHFSRFDHSIVCIEYERLKITTDVTTAERILEGLYGRIF